MKFTAITYWFFLTIRIVTTESEGIIFNHIQDVVVAEEFYEAQIYLPFPTEITTLDSHFDNITITLAQLATTRNYGCEFTSTRMDVLQTMTKMNLLSYAKNEQAFAKTEHENLKREIGTLLRGTDLAPRPTRAAPIVIAGAAAATFGLGIAIGSRLRCGLSGLFASCPDIGKENRAIIDDLITNSNMQVDQITEMNMQNNEKMYLVAQQLVELQKTQAELTDSQNQNWQIINNNIEILQNQTSMFVDCHHSHYVLLQVLNQMMEISNILSTIITNIKAYRVELQAYQRNVHNTIGIMLDNYIPLSLISKTLLTQLLEGILQLPEIRQKQMQLAIPVHDILSYYQTRLVTAVHTNELGIYVVIAIPLSKTETRMQVFKAIAVPMPQEHINTALKWDIETDYIAISENRLEIALLTETQLNQCIGSKNNAVCYETFATETNQNSCLATLYFKNAKDALAVCGLIKHKLPITEVARNLGLGRWLITADNPNFILRQSPLDKSNPLDDTKLPGCRSCIVELPCNSMINGPNIRIRSDIASCKNQNTVNRIDLVITPVLDELFGLIPALNEGHVRFDDTTTMRIALLTQVQQQIHTEYPRKIDNEALITIATPIANDMNKMHHDHSFYQQNTHWITSSSAVILTILLCVFTVFITRRYYAIRKEIQYIPRPQPVRQLHLQQDLLSSRSENAPSMPGPSAPALASKPTNPDERVPRGAQLPIRYDSFSM